MSGLGRWAHRLREALHQLISRASMRCVFARFSLGSPHWVRSVYVGLNIGDVVLLLGIGHESDFTIYASDWTGGKEVLDRRDDHAHSCWPWRPTSHRLHADETLKRLWC